MANKWTEQQASAIESRDQNLLVSAAAGSGKTAVLVQRIISRLTDKTAPVRADRLLVVTFTNAAAFEMRERVIASLTKLTEQNPADAFLAKQLLLMKKAQITTIDSFCIDLLRKHFVAAGLPPDFKIADPTENAVMRGEVLDEILTNLYEDETYAEGLFSLLEGHANAKANDKFFREMVDGLFLFSMSLPNPTEWLQMAAEEFALKKPFDETKWCKAVMQAAFTEIEKCICDYDILIDLATKDNLFDIASDFMQERTNLLEIKNAQSYDELKKRLEEFTFGRRRAVPKGVVPQYLE